MENSIEKLWNEYFAEQCATMTTDEEHILAKSAIEKRKVLSASLSVDQSEALNSYIDILFEIQSTFIKKAFFNGCKFATAFFSTFGKL